MVADGGAGGPGRSRVSGSPRYLWFAPHAGLWPSFRMEHRLADALARAGRDVTMVHCDGVLDSYCPVMSADRLSVTSPRSAKRQCCTDCRHNASITAERGSYGVTTLDAVRDPAVRSRGRDADADVTPDTWQDVEVDGLPVGRYAAYLSMLHHKLPDVDLVGGGLGGVPVRRAQRHARGAGHAGPARRHRAHACRGVQPAVPDDADVRGAGPPARGPAGRRACRLVHPGPVRDRRHLPALLGEPDSGRLPDDPRVPDDPVHAWRRSTPSGASCASRSPERTRGCTRAPPGASHRRRCASDSACARRRRWSSRCCRAPTRRGPRCSSAWSTSVTPRAATPTSRSSSARSAGWRKHSRSSTSCCGCTRVSPPTSGSRCRRRTSCRSSRRWRTCRPTRTSTLLVTASASTTSSASRRPP